MNQIHEKKKKNRLKKQETDSTLYDCLSETAKQTKNANLDKYRCGGCGIGFDSRSNFPIIGEFGINFFLFQV